MSDFEYDVLQKKQLAKMARYQKNGSKSKKCPMSTDHMTRKQWEERCGNVYTFNFNKPMSWAEFKQKDTRIQKEYLLYLIENYHVNGASLSQMFAVTTMTVRKHIEANKLGIAFKVGNSMNGEQKAKWAEFFDSGMVEKMEKSEPSEIFYENETQPIGQENMQCATSDGIKGMNMRQFSVAFEGVVDVDMIANSIRRILGENAHGKIEITYTL